MKGRKSTWFFFGDNSFMPVHITLNGAPRELAAPLTFAQLLDELALAGRRLAVERNGEIVPRSRFSDARVADGDRIEVVMAVGGG